MNQLEAKIVLSADDKTAPSFAAATKHLRELGERFKAVNRVVGARPLVERFGTAPKWLSLSDGVRKFHTGLRGIEGGFLSAGLAAGSFYRSMAPLAGLTVGGLGFASLTQKIMESSSEIDELSKKSRQLGLPLDDIRIFKHIAQLQGVDWGTAKSGLDAGAKAFADIQSHTGKLLPKLLKIDPALARQLQTTRDLGKAYNEILGAIHNAPPAKAIQLSEMLLGSADITKMAEPSPEQLAKLKAETKKRLYPITKAEGEAIEEFEDSRTNLNASIMGLSDNIAVKLLPTMTPIIKGMDDWTRANREWLSLDIAKGVRGLGTELQDVYKTMTAIHDLVVPKNDGWSKWLDDLAKRHGPFTDFGHKAVIQHHPGHGPVVQTPKQAPLINYLGRAFIDTFYADEQSNQGRKQDFGGRYFSGAPMPALPEPKASGPAKKQILDRIERAHRVIVPGRAEGGDVRRGAWNWVGERGPELVRWIHDGHVFSYEESKEIIREAHGRGAKKPGPASLAFKSNNLLDLNIDASSLPKVQPFTIVGRLPGLPSQQLSPMVRPMVLPAIARESNNSTFDRLREYIGTTERLRPIMVPIAGRAIGGSVVKGGINVVGEQGPEIVQWGRDGHVFSNEHSRRLIEAFGSLAAPRPPLPAASEFRHRDEFELVGRAIARFMLLPAQALARPFGQLTHAIEGLARKIDELNFNGGGAARQGYGGPWGGGAAAGASGPTPGGTATARTGAAAWGRQPGLSSPLVKPPPLPGLSSPIVPKVPAWSAGPKMAGLPGSTGMSREAHAMLEGIAAPESGKLGYRAINYMAGGGAFSDFSHHPFVGRKGYTAAGRYQQLASNFAVYGRDQPDFGPHSQDVSGWRQAQHDYHARTGRDLAADIDKPELRPSIIRTLAPTWTGLGVAPGKALAAMNRAYDTWKAPIVVPPQRAAAITTGRPKPWPVPKIEFRQRDDFARMAALAAKSNNLLDLSIGAKARKLAMRDPRDFAPSRPEPAVAMRPEPFVPPRRDRDGEDMPRHKVDIGKGELTVRLEHPPNGPHVAGIKLKQMENINTGISLDKTGGRYWKPGPQP